MDSSPDLSLKLRRGSSDSRESFYMDFAQGIDSDIEEVTTVVEPAPQTLPVQVATSPPPLVAPVGEVLMLGEISAPPSAIVEEDETALSDNGAEEVIDIEEEEQEEEQEEEEEPETIPDELEIPPRNIPIIIEPEQVDEEEEKPDADDEEEQIDEQSEPELPPEINFDEIQEPEEPEEFAEEEEIYVEKATEDGDEELREDDTESQTPSLPPPPPTPPPTPPPPPTDIDESTSNDVGSEQLAASPSSANNTIVSPETLSHHTSPAKSPPQSVPQSPPLSAPHSPPSARAVQSPSSPIPRSPPSVQHHVKIDESPVKSSRPQSPPSTRPGTASVEPLISHESETCIVETATRSSTPNQMALSTPTCSTSGTTQHLALLYHHHTHHQHIHPILTQTRRLSRLPETSMMRYNLSPQREIKPIDAFTTTLSALYGKLIVIMGVAFPLSEVISTYIPPSFYESFYLYLYIGSMVFLLFMYATLLWGRPKPMYTTSVKPTKPPPRRSSSCSSNSGNESDRESETGSSGNNRHMNVAISPPPRRPSLLPVSAAGQQHYGSFYLRMGAVAFGIGSMIYSGLEFGQYFELERDTKCHNVLLALTPATRMAFIFIQMYFIFLNNEQIKVYRHKILARFGLMHMIGTNLAVWLNVLIQETKHEILTFYDPENRTLKISHRLGHKTLHPPDTSVHLRVPRGLKGPHHIFECRRTNIIGTLVQDASPFLFPCTIEYSLICAAILYVMWRNVTNPPQEPPVRRDLNSFKRSPHHYSVDCARAHKGLFVGILILVLTIISLILFFVLISRPEFISLAVTEVTVCELTLYATATIATLIGMIQVRHLQYDAERSFQLDDILLVGAQSGLFLYSTFTVIGGHFTLRKDTILVLINALASIVQTACQTMFILDASRRNAATPEHIRKKPGREIVTFLLVANLAMWAISTLEKSRAESHPIQLNFYGLWAWTIITHVSMPLAIFYRFHSTVCLCEIWKRAYKLKPTYM